MGWFASKRGFSGDGPWDIIKKAFAAVNRCYEMDAGRRLTAGELADAIEFVSRGLFEVTLTRATDTKYPFTEK